MSKRLLNHVMFDFEGETITLNDTEDILPATDFLSSWIGYERSGFPKGVTIKELAEDSEGSQVLAKVHYNFRCICRVVELPQTSIDEETNGCEDIDCLNEPQVVV